MSEDSRPTLPAPFDPAAAVRAAAQRNALARARDAQRRALAKVSDVDDARPTTRPVAPSAPLSTLGSE